MGRIDLAHVVRQPANKLLGGQIHQKVFSRNSTQLLSKVAFDHPAVTEPATPLADVNSA